MAVDWIGLVTSGLGLAAVLIPGFAEWHVRSSGKGRLWTRILGGARGRPSSRHDREPCGFSLAAPPSLLALWLRRIVPNAERKTDATADHLELRGLELTGRGSRVEQVDEVSAPVQKRCIG